MALIKKLHIRGFKSFAKPIDLEFGTGYNCVIGANGSGKSNISDSICFVLGKLSAKSMRVEKASNLIFNGGKKGEPMKEAEVSVVFDNNNKEFPVDSNEVKLTRVVKQTGNSTYKINSEVRTREQMLEMLAAAKIDPDGHNIILQGDIVHFTEMKTEDRREVVEEIAGISVYEDRKAKALNELEKVEVKLNEASIILTERETYLRELKKERDQALRYRELETNVKSNKATHLHIQMDEKRGKIEDAEKKIANHNEDVKRLNEKIASVKKDIERQKKELEEINAEIEEKGEKESVALQRTIENLKTDVVRSTEKLSSSNQSIKRVEERKRQILASIKETETTITYLESTKKEMVANVKELEIKERKLADELTKLRQRSGSDVSKLESLEKDIDSLMIKQQKLHDEQQELMQKKFQIDSKLAAIDETLKRAAELEKTSNADKLKKELAELSLKLSKSLTERDALRNQFNEAKEKMMRHDGELFKLRAMHTSARESVLGDRAIGKILGLKRSGIYGTVRQLGAVEAKHALALEVAAGPRVKSIVVQDDKIAAECIKLLKQERSGIATFLPLNKIQGRAKTPMSGQGIIGNALDLVSFDRRFAPVFSYVFGNTIVVDNIATARRIGVGKIRMATLEGDLVETSGAMIGGFRTRGIGFKEKDIESDLATAEKELENLEKLRNTIEKRTLEIEDEIKELSDKKNSLEGSMIKIRSSLDFNVDDLEKAREVLLKNKIFGDIEDLEKELAETAKNLESLKKEREKFKGAIANLRETDEGSHAKSAEARRQKLREKIVQLTTDMKNIDLQLLNIYSPELEKSRKGLEDADNEMRSLNSEIKNLERAVKEQQIALKEHISKEDKFQKDYKNLFIKRNKTGEDIQKLENSIESEEGKIKLVNERVNDASILRAKLVAEHEALAKEFEEFRGVELRQHISLDKLKDEIKRFETLIVQMGNVNLRALEVYENIKKDYDEILNKIDKLKHEKDDVLQMMAEIEGKKKELFMQSYNLLADHFTKIFGMLSTKGEALLELENKEDPLSAGVEIKVRITGNRFMDIRSLSGGEKTLAALAFIFAIQEFQPASFYLFDEVDAALDKKNSDLLSKFIQKYSQRAQYILISHNDQLISEADYIYGVSMHESGISKVVSLKV